VPQGVTRGICVQRKVWNDYEDFGWPSDTQTNAFISARAATGEAARGVRARVPGGRCDSHQSLNYCTQPGKTVDGVTELMIELIRQMR
jgi:hypothetical protein